MTVRGSTRESTASVAGWFGPAERPLSARLNLPASAHAHGAVVLCPPVGYDYVCAYPTYRTLAEELADRGLLAVRFDYDGTGDSAGSDTDPDRFAAWIASIRAAVVLARAVVDGPVSLVGMRLGGLLAASAATDQMVPLDIENLVLWDPVFSGRHMLRHLRALQLLGVEGGTPGAQPRDDGTLDVAGTTYSAQTAAELKSLTMPDLGSLAPRLLALLRPDTSASALPDGVTVDVAAGQDLLLDAASSVARIPFESIHRIADWLDDSTPQAAAAYALPESWLDTAVVDGVRERFRWLDGGSLFCVETEAVGGADAALPVLLLLNNAADHHIGPGRAWVEMARRLAREGFRSMRIDLSGIGDSPTRDGLLQHLCYGPASVADIRSAAGEIDSGAGVVTVGVCSGGRNGLDAAPHPSIREVYAINANLHIPREVLEPLSTDVPLPPGVLECNTYHRYRHNLRIRLPGWLHLAPELVGRPPLWRQLLQAATRSGTRVTMIYSPEDFALLKMRELIGRSLRLLRRDDAIEVWILPDLDHALMARVGREDAISRIVGSLRSRYGRD